MVLYRNLILSQLWEMIMRGSRQTIHRNWLLIDALINSNAYTQCEKRQIAGAGTEDRISTRLIVQALQEAPTRLVLRTATSRRTPRVSSKFSRNNAMITSKSDNCFDCRRRLAGCDSVTLSSLKLGAGEWRLRLRVLSDLWNYTTMCENVFAVINTNVVPFGYS